MTVPGDGEAASPNEPIEVAVVPHDTDRGAAPISSVEPGGSAVRQLGVSIVLPGLATRHRSAPLGAVLLAVGVGLPIAVLAWMLWHRNDLIWVGLDRRLLTAIIVVGIAAVVARVVAVVEVARAFAGSPSIRLETAIAALVVAAVSVPVLLVAHSANENRIAVGKIFSSGGADPLFQPDAADPFRPVPAADGGVAEPVIDDEVGGPVVDDEVVEPVVDDEVDRPVVDDGDVEPAVDRADPTDGGRPAAPIDPAAVRTTLLLGGDAGPGRWGMRTDSMILFGVHEASGRSALVSIPRNLMALHFPPGTPLAEEYPNGFDDLANAVFTHVATTPELVDAYGRDGQLPQAVALAQGLGYSLDVRIDDFVLLDMQAFKDIVDAVGGVRVELSKRVLLQKSNPVGDYDPPEALGPGVVEMDGTLAIAYVRARRGDSDYQRMHRQRKLLVALSSQVSIADAVAAFPRVDDVLGDSMRTSLSSGEFAGLVDRLGENAKIGESVGLVPPLITPAQPDYADVQAIIDAVERYLVTGEPSGFG